MLESLRIRNFKQHGALDIVFPSGMTICTGKNYKGKSTVLQAVLFAFFGVSAVPGGSKLVVRRGAANPDLNVQVAFFHQGKRYRLERTFSTATLYCADQVTATGKSAVNKELEEILGTSQKFFLRLKYAEQGETQALLTMGAEELHKIVEHVSGASVVNEVILRASQRATSAAARLEEVGDPEPLEPLRKELGDLQKKQQVDTATYAAHYEAVQARTAELRLTDAKLRETLEQNQALETRRTNQRSLNGQLSQALHQQQAAQDTLVEYGEVQNVSDCQEEYARLSEAARLYKEWSTLVTAKVNALEAAEKAKVSNQVELKSLNGQLSLVPEADVHAAYEKTLEAAKTLSAWEAELGNRQQALTQGVCSACGRAFENIDPVAMQQAVTEAEANVAKARSYERAAQAAYFEVQDLAKKRQGLVAEIQAIEKVALPALATKHAELTQAIGEGRKAMDKIGDPPSPSEVQAAHQRWMEASTAATIIAKATKELEEAEALANKLKTNPLLEEEIPDNAAIDPLYQQVEEARRLQQSAQIQAEETQRFLTQIKFEIGTLETRIQQVEAVQARATELATQIDTAKRLVKYLKTNRDRFMAQLWQQVMAYASEFASACTGGAIERLLRTEAGTFEFVESGESVPLAAASGAQKSIMSVAVQLAFDALLPDGFGALMLDEPTSQMDEDHALALSQMLANSGRQIIMVSHRENDAALAQAHVHLN